MLRPGPQLGNLFYLAGDPQPLGLTLGEGRHTALEVVAADGCQAAAATSGVPALGMTRSAGLGYHWVGGMHSEFGLVAEDAGLAPHL